MDDHKAIIDRDENQVRVTLPCGYSQIFVPEFSDQRAVELTQQMKSESTVKPSNPNP